MIPLICEVKELKYVKKTVVETADEEIKEVLLVQGLCNLLTLAIRNLVKQKHSKNKNFIVNNEIGK